ncbi:Ribonuclease h domain [Thalictrum thalictroides]|uniref:Ribonuclease h domain n=1 Tax=Thalictrum thalictroides TaxID=46969 RepID=A0A7J6VDQ3_THATH|nr:Ribonuclease h domain [Thalictrum thalictroides]
MSGPAKYLTGIRETTMMSDFIDHNKWKPPPNSNTLVIDLWQTLQEVEIGEREEEDTAVWTPSPNGKFTIKSAYVVLRTRYPKAKWAKAIWGNPMIPRHSFITWLAAKERLFTQDKHMKWGSLQKSVCALCTDLTTRDQLLQSGSCYGMSNYFKVQWHNHDLPPICNRNHYSQVFYYGMERSPMLVWYSERSYGCSIRMGLDFNHNERRLKSIFYPRTLSLAQAREPPDRDFIMFNTDGSISPEGNSYAGILRDFNGDVLMTYSANSKGCTIGYVEIQAIQVGLQLCKDLGIKRIQVRSDSKEAVDCIIGTTQATWRSRQLTSKIKALQSSFEDIQIKHIFREMNSAADWLAKHKSPNDFCMYASNPLPR